jgi:hypothetical protein
LCFSIKKGSELPADFLSSFAIDAMGICLDNWKLKQKPDEFCHLIKKKLIYTHKHNFSCRHLEIADSCFTVGGILWKRITIHCKQKTFPVTQTA